jgi:hypothetical protein
VELPRAKVATGHTIMSQARRGLIQRLLMIQNFKSVQIWRVVVVMVGAEQLVIRNTFEHLLMNPRRTGDKFFSL